MDHRARKLVFAGIIICLIVSAFAVYIIGWIEASIDRNLVTGIWLAKVIIATVQFGVAPFGAALAAIGLAFHWIGGSTSTGSPDAGHRSEVGESRDGN